MYYYEVLVADSRYRSDSPLIYSHDQQLVMLSVVGIPLRGYMATGFILKKVSRPKFAVKPIKKLLSERPLPAHALELADWIKRYYATSLGEALKQFAPPTQATGRQTEDIDLPRQLQADLKLEAPLTTEQVEAIKQINAYKNTTVLLHGETGSGKTRVYLELAKQVLAADKSVIILTPEIGLTSQLQLAIKKSVSSPVHVIHSQLTPAQRRQVWLKIIESQEPVVIVGPRSALFSPVNKLGLIVVDEAHEPAYKQAQSPRYNAVRVASQLGLITSSRVVLGSATPNVSDYYLASEHGAVVRMRLQAASGKLAKAKSVIIDKKERSHFRNSHVLSDQLIDAIKTTMSAGKQALLYHNLRGTVRLIMCNRCGWQLLCPNCDIPLVYHADTHRASCHICGYGQKPPTNCPVCNNPEIIYKNIGTKALTEIVQQLFPEATIGRFDSDNAKNQRLNNIYEQLHAGKIEILVGTQQLAKGLDLPKLALVGVVSAESALSLPDFGSEERAFQLLYQVSGRVGRGHGDGQVIVQTYEPDNKTIRAALSKDYGSFYERMIDERRQYKFPPYCFLLKLVCKRTTSSSAQKASQDLKTLLAGQGLPVEISGPAQSFYQKRGRNYYWQLVVKAKSRGPLTEIAKQVPSGWTVDLDPADLL